MKYYLTKERLEELKRELEHLRKDARVEIAERLKRAKEYGDLSENAEYIDAKDAQAKLEADIFEREEVLRNAVVIIKPKANGKVTVGSTVEVQKNGTHMRYTIVGSEEADPLKNFISNESPLGSAFLGREVGESVEVGTPGGTVKYKIVKIE